MRTVIAVVFMLLIIALVVWAMDFVFKSVMSLVYPG